MLALLLLILFKISVSVSTLCQIHSERLDCGAITSGFVHNSNAKTNYF